MFYFLYSSIEFLPATACDEDICPFIHEELRRR
jgi:hypothetical protein